MVKKSDKIRIRSNWKLLIIILFLIIILGFLIYFIAKEDFQIDDNNSKCRVDKDCVQVCGCHPNSCIPFSQRGNCEKMICTQECSGPLDCNAGYCGCVNGRCNVISNK